MTRVKFRTSPGPIRIRDSGTLPHWDTEEGLYFVTFRLADSLPSSLFKPRCSNPNTDNSQYRRAVERTLDHGLGNCYLKNPDVAQVVADCLAYLDGKAFLLLAWCIMPNHVHLVFRLEPGCELWKVMHSLKTYTARRANRILKRRGPFWQGEYFDRLVWGLSTGSSITSSQIPRRPA